MNAVIVGKEIRQDWDAAMTDPTVIEMLNEMPIWDVPAENNFGFMTAAKDEYRRRTGEGYVTMGAVSRALIMLNNERLVDGAMEIDPSLDRELSIAALNAKI